MVGNFIERFKAWGLRHPYWMLTLVTIAVLAPFLAKPFNLDDPCYIWVAKHILAHPADPYGFEVNWYGFTQSMWQVTQNPPLISYYLALMSCVFGWSEIGLHCACLLPAIMVVLGSYRLAERFCRWPWLAAAATLFAPGFLVSSTTVMCDVSMLAFWVWAVIFWIEGIEHASFKKMAAAAILAALAILTKYNGICLLPLLVAYGLLAKRPVARWGPLLLIPAAVFLAYEWITLQLYGQALFSTAARYAKSAQAAYGISKIITSMNALTFIGGCFAMALFCSPFLWRRKVWLTFFLGAAGFMFLALVGGEIVKNYSWLNGQTILLTEAQILIWTAGGVCVLALAVADVWRTREPGAYLLAFWVLGVFAFAALFNWTVNARSILPMAPAVAILIARRFEQTRLTLPAGIYFPIMASAVLSFASAQADFQMANVTRITAGQFCTKFATLPGRVWFEGHWGFQYYMQSFGAWPLDANASKLQAGDFLIIPEQNSSSPLPTGGKLTCLETVEAPRLAWFATMDPAIGAGFYSSLWGPLPIAFGRTTPEKYIIYGLK